MPDTVIPEPAIAVKKSATVSFLEALLSSASINAMLSAEVSSTPALKLSKLIDVKYELRSAGAKLNTPVPLL